MGMKTVYSCDLCGQAIDDLSNKTIITDDGLVIRYGSAFIFTERTGELHDDIYVCKDCYNAIRNFIKERMKNNDQD